MGMGEMIKQKKYIRIVGQVGLVAEESGPTPVLKIFAVIDYRHYIYSVADEGRSVYILLVVNCQNAYNYYGYSIKILNFFF